MLLFYYSTFFFFFFLTVFGFPLGIYYLYFVNKKKNNISNSRIGKREKIIENKKGARKIAPKSACQITTHKNIKKK